jgi:hypothetical protein
MPELWKTGNVRPSPAEDLGVAADAVKVHVPHIDPLRLVGFRREAAIADTDVLAHFLAQSKPGANGIACRHKAL